uniref:Uncharacterized protein n=1 Tax=Anguilla anguilla TaxID=7936 RepID=A0A0E9T8S8_ANGAN
MLLVSLCQLV